MVTDPPRALRRVVLVDDSRTIVELIKVYLIGFGFHYHTTTNPHEALELVRKHRPFLLISDINMPEMSGLELAERIRADRALDGVGILVLSSDKSYSLQSITNADGFLPKPINGEKLANEATRILKKRESFRKPR